jgi:hypothetical protein
MQAMIQREIAKAIAPMAQTFEQQKVERDFSSNFEEVITNLGGNVPQYKDALLPAVREILGSAPPTPQNIHTATVIAIGNATIAANRNGSTTPNNTGGTVPSNTKPKVLPPNSPNRAPVTNPKKVEMNETMKRLMLKSGYKEGEEADFMKALNSEEVSFDYRGKR